MIFLYLEVIGLFSTNIQMNPHIVKRPIAFSLAYIPFYQILGFHGILENYFAVLESYCRLSVGTERSVGVTGPTLLHQALSS